MFFFFVGASTTASTTGSTGIGSTGCVQTDLIPFSDLWSSRLTLELGTDDVSRLFTTARRKKAINNGLLQFADLTECLQRQSTVTGVHGQREYDLNCDDYLRLSKQGPEYHHTDSNGNVKYVAADDFPRRDVAWLNQNQAGWRASTGGTPSAYYERIDGGYRYFGVDTPPQIGSSETGAFLVPYVARPPTLTSDTEAAFTFAGHVRTDLNPFVQAAVHFAASDLEKLRVNGEASQGQLQLAIGYVQRFLQTFKPAGPKVLRTARNYFSDVRLRRVDSDGVNAWPW